MKTKHILTALALPMMFAACTADDFEGVNALQQSERAKLSKDFVLNTVGEVESRYAVETDGAGLKFNFEEGDLIGANLIDQFVPGEEDPAKWDIIYSVSPSLPFKNIGLDQWKSDKELGVGNYLFTYPYNAKDNNRAAATYELQTIQDLSEGDLNAAIEAGNKAVGAVVLYEGQTNANVNMKNLFTYPKFILTFDNGENISEVSKVALKGNFVAKAGYDHKKVAALFADDYAKFAALTTAARANLLWEVEAGKTYDKEINALNWELVQTSDFLIAEGSAGEAYGKPETVEFLIAELNQKVTEDAAGNKAAEVRFMMPSVENFNTLTNVTLYAYTDNGVYAKDLKAENCNFKSTTTEAAKRKALYRSRTNTLTLKQMAKVSDENNNIVTSIADWNQLVAKYGSNEDADVKVAVIATSFSLNEDAEMPTEAIFKVNTNVAVDGNVTLNNLSIAGDITVKKDATLNLGKDLEANKIINKGTVIVAEKADVTGIDNEGTLVVKNNGKLIAKNEAVSRAAKAVVINNKGIMTVEEGGDVKANVNNYATLNINGYVNSTLVNGKSDAKKEDNAKAIITMGETTKAVLKGAVTNYGKINTAKGATVVVSSNAGEVVYVDGTDLTSNGTVSYVSAETAFGPYYFVDADDEATAKKSINKLYLTKSATFTGTATGKVVDYSGKTIELAEGADITVAAGHTLKIGELIVVGKSAIAKTTGSIVIGTLTVKEEGDLSAEAAITATNVKVEEDAYLTIGAALSAGSLVNKGSVTNNASVTLPFGGLTDEGYWTGDEAFIGISAAEDAFNKALNTLVIDWIDNTATTSWSEATVANMKNCGWAATGAKWYSANAVDVVAKWNVMMGYDASDADYKPFSKANVDAILTAKATSVANYVDAYKTAAKTLVVNAISARVDLTNKDSKIYAQAVDLNFIPQLKRGTAYMGKTNGALEDDYKTLWEEYINAIAIAMVNWTDYDSTNEVYVATYKNEANNLRNGLKLILDGIKSDIDKTNATTSANENVDPATVIAIPTGSYISAENTTNNYKAVLAWMSNAGYNSGSTNFVAGMQVSLETIQNWYLKAYSIENPKNMTEQNAKAAANLYKDVVVTWKAPVHSNANMAALVNKLMVAEGTELELGANPAPVAPAQ